MRRAAQRDANEAEIVAALRTMGRQVTRLSGEGVPDLLVIRPARDVPVFVCETVEQAMDAAMAEPVCLIEVKGKGGTLRPAQVEWFKAATLCDVEPRERWRPETVL